MHIAIPVAIALACILIAVRILILFRAKIDFFSKGLDSQFSASEISALWKLAKECELENPEALYVSLPALNECINMVIQKAKVDGTEESSKLQDFLSKLYNYRTRVALDAERKKGLESTRYLSEGQRVRIILKGKGVFASRIVSCGRELIFSMPHQFNPKTNTTTILKGEDWEGKMISVYLWRKGDASYAFDTVVAKSGVFRNNPVLFAPHADKLDRAQKRQSVRAVCEIYAQMYLVTTAVTDYNAVESEPGYRCLLEDISSDGAMIRIGGKGRNNVQIKIQFTVNGSFVMMYGVVRAVEYNQAMDQSRLHFECTHIAPSMRNAVLSYVYNVIPPEEAEINEAIMQSEEDAKAEEAEKQSLDAAAETKIEGVTGNSEYSESAPSSLNQSAGGGDFSGGQELSGGDAAGAESEGDSVSAFGLAQTFGTAPVAGGKVVQGSDDALENANIPAYSGDRDLERMHLAEEDDVLRRINENS